MTSKEQATKTGRTIGGSMLLLGLSITPLQRLRELSKISAIPNF